MKLPRLKNLINGFTALFTKKAHDQQLDIHNTKINNTKENGGSQNTDKTDQELIEIISYLENNPQETYQPFVDENIEQTINEHEEIEQENNKITLENPLKPFLRDYLGRPMNHDCYNEPNEIGEKYTRQAYEAQNRPMTPTQYEETIKHYLDLKNFMHEDKAPILKKMWDDCMVVYEMLSPLKELDLIYTIDLTGGCVRDFILNKHHDIKDLDFMISIPGFSQSVCNKYTMERIFSKELLQEVNWEESNYGEEAKAKLIQLCILKSQYKESLNKVYCFSGRDRQEIIGQTVYDNGSKDDTLKNDRLAGVITLNDSHTHYPIDFLLTDWIKPAFLRDFDFDLCKVSFCIYNPTYNKDFPKDYSHLISRFSADQHFWADVINKTFTYNTYERSQNQINKSFNNHLIRMQQKYPDYQLNIIGKGNFNYDYAVKMSLNNQLEKELSTKDTSVSQKRKI